MPKFLAVYVSACASWQFVFLLAKGIAYLTGHQLSWFWVLGPLWMLLAVPLVAWVFFIALVRKV